MWTQYQRLAVCIRRGASTVESTLFPTQSKPPTTALGTNMTSPGGSVSAKKTDDLTPIFAMKSFPSTHTSRTPRIALNAAVSAPSAAAAGGSSTASITAAAVTDSAAVLPSLEQCTDAALQLMSSPPSSDHALAYTVLDSGVSKPNPNTLTASDALTLLFPDVSVQMVVVALATMDSELFVTFPSMVRRAPCLRCCTLTTCGSPDRANVMSVPPRSLLWRRAPPRTCCRARCGTRQEISSKSHCELV